MTGKEPFKVNLINPDKGLDITLEVSGVAPILDDATELGIELPYSCRSGACFDCLAKLVAGQVEQTDIALSRLTPEELKQGYILLCSCFATSNCTLLTHQMETFFD